MRCPCTITCAPVSLSGFSSTGFMSVCGARPAAIACSACARPISPPSSVTAALLDMFCGLNGATSSPRRANARTRPATSMDLPTLEPAPCIMIARVMPAPDSPPAAGVRECKKSLPVPGRDFMPVVAAGRSGRFGLRRRVAPLAFFARQRDGCAHTLRDKIHQPGHHTFVGVDSGAAQHLATIARACPTGDLLGAVAIFLVVGDGVIQRGQYDGREKFAGTVALFRVQGRAIDEILHESSL